MPRTLLLTLLLAVVLNCSLGCTREPVSTSETPPASSAASLVDVLTGRLILSGEGGRRGVEVHIWVTHPDGHEQQIWILPDDDGRFEQELPGELTRVRVFAGREVFRVEGDELPRVDDRGRVELGSIDLRASLVSYRVRVREAANARDGVFRVGVWISPPQTGPRGELPSLGSRQFPTIEIGREVEWLLPPNTDDVYFLVERPIGPHHDTWRSGEQQLFGPIQASDYPLELILD